MPHEIVVVDLWDHCNGADEDKEERMQVWKIAKYAYYTKYSVNFSWKS